VNTFDRFVRGYVTKDRLYWRKIFQKSEVSATYFVDIFAKFLL